MAAVEKAGIRAYLALHKTGGRPGCLPKSAFAYDAEKDRDPSNGNQRKVWRFRVMN